MNRRKAIARILLFGGAGAAIAGGASYYHFNKKPDLLDLDQYLPLIAELAEVIIPETDTPGAKSAGVHDFIVTMIRDCSSRKVQNRFLYGLEDVASYARTQYNKSFVHCSKEDKATIVAHFEKKSRPWEGLMGKISSRLFGDSFFMTLKKYTVIGYCTSMQGATKAMAYEYIPGRYQGCIPLQPGQRCWATE
ncbi:gluconate 2-dehydrogenase subunit 3 family protein [Chitinophaga oryzae]|uniref:Gluconate 2-dehydrogenase subunit 3 family protein n=1 Tax=Chitinophaga oryzae TaxID=2725414 RepID=A0AAE6ZDR1_9BACT|nr:gluconate 2-dehydrogenase subunit 3 family protein [Chitinophaga oryzae]QJB31043.1 gluconate 2-dehydrogenase subunit 3 family protein [Chitinophaga oryzae]QJB37527.1 gluconate 2-dehydrogenase subunit 3 family protein [Chitinophaga oryzae]